MAEPAIRLVVGLGNPGAEFEGTRHNVGFMALDALLQALLESTPGQSGQSGKTPYKKVRCDAVVSEVEYGSTRLVLAKPQTFMNRSGKSVKGLLKHYDLTIEEALVIHDDLDLPAGSFRVKQGGGHGGHNGLRSISDTCGTDFARVKVGIGRPPGRMPADRFVLQVVTGNALEELKVDAARAADIALVVLKEGVLAGQNAFNGPG